MVQFLHFHIVCIAVGFRSGYLAVHLSSVCISVVAQIPQTFRRRLPVHRHSRSWIMFHIQYFSPPPVIDKVTGEVLAS
jgi:hypothetical protein